MQKNVLTTGDIAAYCGVNFRTVIRWIQRGLLNAYKLPGRGDNRVQLPEFLNFLKRHNMPIPEELLREKPRLLVVDDEPVTANAIAGVLARRGYETKIALDGFSAGAQLGTFKPDVMTLDLQMPGLSGFEVLRYLRSQDVFRHIGVLVVSALPVTDLERSIEAGADDYLPKPFEYEALIEKVRHLSAAGAMNPQRMADADT